MIKTLKRKFVMAAMTAITALILVLLGAINAVNAWGTLSQSDRLLDMLSATVINPSPGNRPIVRDKGSLARPAAEDTKLSAVYFTVLIDTVHNQTVTDISHIASVTEEEAVAMAAGLGDDAAMEGKTGLFKYKIMVSPDRTMKTYVFLNISSQLSSILRVLILSLLVGLLCWGVMLLLVILLSKKAIAPIAANIEKQERFVTDAGHEIKTPLAIILANTEAMELHQGESKWSRNIREQVNRLTGLTQTLLTLAKMNEGTINLRTETLSLSELVTETIQMFQEPAKIKRLVFTRSIAPSVSITANKEHILRLLSILLDNAVKYTPEDGNVIVILKKENKKTFLQLKNTCKSFPDVPPDALFDRFFRADSARTQKNGGYGIGLSAAKAIVELYHGKITASYGKDGMISFTVKL